MNPTTHVLVDATEENLGASLLIGTLDALLRCEESMETTFISVQIVIHEKIFPREIAIPRPHWRIRQGEPAIAIANQILRSANPKEERLLIVRAGISPDATSLRELSRTLDADPHFCAASARLGGFQEQLVYKLEDSLGDPEIDLIPRSVVQSGAHWYFSYGRVGPCCLLKGRVLRDFGPLDERFETLDGSLRCLLLLAKRTGFRSVFANPAIVRSALESPSLSQSRAQTRDYKRLSDSFPELGKNDEQWSTLQAHTHEGLLARAASFSPHLRKTLLIDLSGMPVSWNGTTEAILGILSGMVLARNDWRITLLAPPDRVEFFNLPERFPDFERLWPLGHEKFTVAFRPMQPWSFDDLILLHSSALFNFTLILDTILEDVLIDAPPHMKQVWGVLGKMSDGLIFNSEYTQQHFRNRFPIGPHTDEYASRHSLDPNEYRNAEVEQTEGKYIYIVGNSYTHKWLAPTLRDLTSAFPYVPFKALGFESDSSPNLECVPSGNLPEATVDHFFANARMIIFPSQYEGFGFPVVKGLAYGHVVIARQSDLLTEIADHYRGPGTLIAFDGTEELIRAVGKVLHSEPMQSLPLGRALAQDQQPATWQDVARGLLDFIEERSDKHHSSNWLEREGLVRSMWAFR